jgi:uncharacterized repeat protein (TIGR01451 family)
MKLVSQQTLKKMHKFFSVFMSLVLVLQAVGPGVLSIKVANATSNESEHQKVNICHKDGNSGNWNALNVDANGWNGHSGHDDDYLYAGPLNEDGKPKTKENAGNLWCKNHVAPKLTVTKTVVNAGGGTKTANDFNLKVDSVSVLSGVAVKTTVGTHTVTETNLEHYTAGVWGGDCNENGQVTLAYGDNKTCTITNTYKAPQQIENTCVDPSMNGGGKIVSFGVSPEDTLQKVLTDAGYTVNTVADETGYTSFNVPAGTASVSFVVKLIDKKAGNTQTFGYYTNGDVANFVPVFSVPPTVSGTVSAPVTVNTTGVTKIGFAIKTTNGDTTKTFATEPNALNSDNGSDDHAVVYNVTSNKYIVAFEDLPFATSDKDYNDLVVEVSITNCTKVTTECKPGVELLKNGDFEKPVVTNPASWDVFTNSTPDLGWTIEWFGGSSTYNEQNRPDPKLELQNGVMGWLAQGGNQYAELDTDWGGPSSGLSGEPASVKIYQDIPTVPGKKYDVSFAFSPRPNSGSSENMLDVLWGATTVDSLTEDGTSNANTVWKTHTYTITATEPVTRLAFIDKGTPNSVGTFLDSVSVQCAKECKAIEGVVVSDATTSVGDGNAVALNYIHPGWTANIPGATWIWSTDPVQNPGVTETKTFTKKFTVGGTATSGSLDIASDNYYKVWVNGVLVGEEQTDENNFQSGTQDHYDVTSLLKSGENTITIEGTNKGVEGSDATSNPAGILFKLVWVGKNCGDDDNGGDGDHPTSKIHFKKYVDGKVATSESAQQKSFVVGVQGGDWAGDVVLDAEHSYEGASGAISDEFSSVSAAEQTKSEVHPNSVVVSSQRECSPGMFYVDGYTTSNLSFADAATKTVSSNNPSWLTLSGDQYVIVWNKSCPTTSTVIATKIVCTNEADLPNWGNGGPAITSTTATNWVAEHNSCHLEPNWQFEWAPSGTADAGNTLLGPAGAPWVTSGMTANDGTVSISIPAQNDQTYVWFREVLKAGYIPFTYGNDPQNPNGNNKTAEVYCNVDVKNYDNYDRIDNLKVGNTYYCVAWNSPVKTDVGIEKTVDNANPNSGATVTYTINVTNHGPETATNVKVTEALPAGLTYSSNTATQGTYDSGTNMWSVGALTLDQTATLTLKATVTGEGTITNAADVTIDPQIDINTENNHDQVDITVKKEIVTGCTTNCGEDGPHDEDKPKDDDKPTPPSSGSRHGIVAGSTSGGSSGGGSVTKKPDGEVLGAFTGLPNTGIGPITLNPLTRTATTRTQNTSTTASLVFASLLSLFILNYVSIKVLKLHKK